MYKMTRAYADGVADVDITALIATTDHRRLSTVTAVQPRGVWGASVWRQRCCERLSGKAKFDGGWINGGFCAGA